YTSVWLGEERGAAERESAGPQVAEPAEKPAIVEPDPSAGDELIVPVGGVRAEQLSDTFADARTGGERLHEALDIMAPRGTPVLSAVGGKVESLFQSEAGGNTIYVRSDDRRTIYYYAHLDAYAPGLGEGDAVGRGQTLGTVGS